MARLLIKSEGFRDQVIELRLGVNRIGRASSNDFQIEHPTISAVHCEVSIGEGEVVIRDCDSTNGTTVDGKRITEARLKAGETFYVGEIEFLVENTDFKIAIPKFDVTRAAPPIVLSDGSLICPRHPGVRVTHRCTYCHSVLCDECVHVMKRRGGKVLKLCALCSHRCEPIGPQKPKQKSILAFLQKTVKLPLLGRRRGK